jgi:hypothetical protein
VSSRSEIVRNVWMTYRDARKHDSLFGLRGKKPRTTSAFDPDSSVRKRFLNFTTELFSAEYLDEEVPAGDASVSIT